MRTTRLQTALIKETADSEIQEKAADVQQRLLDVEEQVNQKDCYFCLEPLGVSSILMVCGHGYHVGCGVQARNVMFRAHSDALQGVSDGVQLSRVSAILECGMCRYQFQGDDASDICEVHRLVSVSKAPMKPSNLADVKAVAAEKLKELDKIVTKLEVAEGILCGRYNCDNLPPKPERDCIVM